MNSEIFDFSVEFYDFFSGFVETYLIFLVWVWPWADYWDFINLTIIIIVTIIIFLLYKPKLN